MEFSSQVAFSTILEYFWKCLASLPWNLESYIHIQLPRLEVVLFHEEMYAGSWVLDLQVFMILYSFWLESQRLEAVGYFRVSTEIFHEFIHVLQNFL